ncbi:unnamed protein product [Closterium sp. NIES-64]|nr:unnamed protein product [Closterium sp. NIES-64]
MECCDHGVDGRHLCDGCDSELAMLSHGWSVHNLRLPLVAHGAVVSPNFANVFANGDGIFVVPNGATKTVASPPVAANAASGAAYSADVSQPLVTSDLAALTESLWAELAAMDGDYRTATWQDPDAAPPSGWQLIGDNPKSPRRPAKARTATPLDKFCQQSVVPTAIKTGAAPSRAQTDSDTQQHHHYQPFAVTAMQDSVATSFETTQKHAAIASVGASASSKQQQQHPFEMIAAVTPTAVTPANVTPAAALATAPSSSSLSGRPVRVKSGAMRYRWSSSGSLDLIPGAPIETPTNQQQQQMRQNPSANPKPRPSLGGVPGPDRLTPKRKRESRRSSSDPIGPCTLPEGPSLLARSCSAPLIAPAISNPFGTLQSTLRLPPTAQLSAALQLPQSSSPPGSRACELEGSFKSPQNLTTTAQLSAVLQLPQSSPPPGSRARELEAFLEAPHKLPPSAAAGPLSAALQVPQSSSPPGSKAHELEAFFERSLSLESSCRREFDMQMFLKRRMGESKAPERAAELEEFLKGRMTISKGKCVEMDGGDLFLKRAYGRMVHRG